MRITAGLLVTYRSQILLVQQSYDDNKNHLSIPKGGVANGECYLDAAIRETAEETGITFDKKYIDLTPRLLNVNNEQISRRLIYFIANLPEDYILPQIKITDQEEVTWAGMISYEKAFIHIQRSQLPILFHLNETHVDARILEHLLSFGYISKSKHPTAELYIYNYTQKCKREEYWNEVTLWCRGIILDEENTIQYHPFKKFFEFEQLYPEFRPTTRNFKIYEKKDGFLGILYWVDGLPFLTTRNSFISYPGVRGNAILYNKYSRLFSYFNPRYTYFFEIVFPNNFLVTDYGETEDLFLLGAYDNNKNQGVSLENIELPMPRVQRFEMKETVFELLQHDSAHGEGYVLLFGDNSRLKIKFPQYKAKYKLKHENDYCSAGHTDIE